MSKEGITPKELTKRLGQGEDIKLLDQPNPNSFRVWDKQEEGWLESTGCYLSPIGQLWIWSIEFAEFRPCTDPERYIICFYTGITDKDGEPVHTGDIIKRTYPAGFTNYKVMYGEWDNGESYSDHESGQFWHLEAVYEKYNPDEWPEQHYEKWLSPGEVLENAWRISGCKVIGNIYADPKLLGSSLEQTEEG